MSVAFQLTAFKRETCFGHSCSSVEKHQNDIIWPIRNLETNYKKEPHNNNDSNTTTYYISNYNVFNKLGVGFYSVNSSLERALSCSFPKLRDP